MTLAFPITNLLEVFPRRPTQQIPNISQLQEGAIELRGQTIPLFNISKVAALTGGDQERQLGVVIESKKKLLAFFVDEVLGIASVKTSRLNDIDHKNAQKTSLFKRGFNSDHGFASVVDIEQLFQLPDILTTDRQEKTQLRHQSQHPPMMTFEAGGALYSVPAVEVFAAVPKQAINQTAIATGPCLGEITYHGRRIPVICPVSVLGLGHSKTALSSEILALRFSDDLVMGLAVDAIRDIRTFSDTKEANLPIWQGDECMISTVFIERDGEQVYVVDLNKLRKRTDLLEIARLSLEDKTEDINEVAQRPNDGNIIQESQRYLVVETHQRLAVPLLQVTCILEPPGQLTRAHAPQSGFLGYFSRLGQMVGLIDLRARMGGGYVRPQQGQVLLTEENGRQVGFLVDRVLGIEISEWREKDAEVRQSFEAGLVQLGSGNAVQVVPYCDLFTHLNASELTPGSAPHPSHQASVEIFA